MALDPTTLFAVNLTVSSFLGVALLFYARFQKTYRGFGYWTLSSLLMSAAYLVMLLRQAMPLGLNILLLNGAFVLAAVVRLHGTTLFMTSRPSLPRGLWAVVAIGVFDAIFYWGHDSIAVRHLALNVLLTGLGWCIAWVLVRNAPAGAKAIYRAAGAMFFGVGFILTGRAVAQTAFGDYALLDNSTLNTAYYLFITVFEVGWALSYTMMNSQRLEQNLAEAREEVKVLSGLLPVCAGCKKIRDDDGHWQPMERYVSERSEAQFSHSLCPDCLRENYPDLAERVLRRGAGRQD